MDFKEVVKNRYSCKKYSDRQVEAEKLDAILAAGRLAPTAKNLQEQRDALPVWGADSVGRCF